MVMGCKYIIWVMFYISLSPLIQQGFTMDSFKNPNSLDAFIQEYAQRALVKPRTGILYNLSLPSNFSGMEVSIVRVRSGTFWTRGANFSFFHIPPRIITMPFVKRFDIVYQNLGNWSSYYYNVPNYTLVAPVIGLMTYGAMNSSEKGSQMLNLSIKGDSILVRFPQILRMEERNATMKCVRFGTDGSVQFSNMTKTNECIATDKGHFTIVVPSPSKKKKKEELWKWWVVGFGVGGGGLVLFILVGILVGKTCRGRKMDSMEREMERSEALDTIWIGRSKMPSATGIRTQPVLENEYVP